LSGRYEGGFSTCAIDTIEAGNFVNDYIAAISGHSYRSSADPRRGY
jgi:hypothetical protein